MSVGAALQAVAEQRKKKKGKRRKRAKTESKLKEREESSANQNYWRYIRRLPPTTSHRITRNFLMLKLYKLEGIPELATVEIRARSKKKKEGGKER